ncbi:hypothetical protein ACIBG0_10560 [Nocardia sp. NPDC050630]|uniref:hypothetical protein n=1 Tax=Nocardia sp. NPDC050630 TaxID=3364321 RepID=UPI0037AFF33C
MTGSAVQKTGHRDIRTQREDRALCGLVQQRAMQVDVLAEFLGTGRNHVYELAANFRTAGLVHPLRRIGAGPKWIVPTRRAVTWFFGHSRPDWQPSPLWSIRGRAVARTRIALGATAREEWESERELSYRAHHPRRYPYDGQVLRTDGVNEAVLVITTADTSAADLVQQATRAGQRAVDDRCARLLIVHTEPAGAALVRAAVTSAPLSVTLGVTTVTLEALTRDGRAALRDIRAGQRMKSVA